MAIWYFRRLFCSFLLLVMAVSYAQEDSAVESAAAREVSLIGSGESRILDSIAFNVHLQVHTAYYSGIFELGENVPRFGTSLFRSVGEKTRVFARLEYGLNLSQGTKFNNNANSPSDFINDPFQEPEPFSARLGFLGIAHETLGSLSLGKQWGVYYDVGGYTDGFTVFGSSGVDVYAGSTDGGWKGTGRADVAVVYRNHFRNLHLGLQTQLFGSHTNYGASLTYQFSPRFNAGIAWNLSNIPDEFQFLVESAEVSSNNLIGGYKFAGKKLYSALTVAYIEERYRRLSDEVVVAFPVMGTEFLNRYTLTPRIKIEGGFNAQWQVGNESEFDGGFRLLQFYAGVNYYFGKLFSVYLQGRLDDSRFVPAVTGSNVIILGLSFDFIKGVGRSS